MTGPDRQAWQAAFAVQESFDEFQLRFREITARARGRFEACDWQGTQLDAGERLELYGRGVSELVEQVRELLGEGVYDHLAWREMRRVYARMIAGRRDLELAETFFNSVTRRIFSTVGVNHDIEFVDSDFDSMPAGAPATVFRSYALDRGLEPALATVLDEAPVAFGPGRVARDAAAAARALTDKLGEHGAAGGPGSLEVARPIFYRNTGAYIVCRLRRGALVTPVVLALRHFDDGIGVDAVLTDEDEVSASSSASRARTSTSRRSARASWSPSCKSIMPRKPVAELYISIGHNKHGKTELYRALLRHLAPPTTASRSRPATAGLVMVVFTLPSFDVVFKVIRDAPGPPKRTTRHEVMDQLPAGVHARPRRPAGRRAGVRAPALRAPTASPPELLDELSRQAPGTVVARRRHGGRSRTCTPSAA